jgi:hypothetical protein
LASWNFFEVTILRFVCCIFSILINFYLRFKFPMAHSNNLHYMERWISFNNSEIISMYCLWGTLHGKLNDLDLTLRGKLNDLDLIRKDHQVNWKNILTSLLYVSYKHWS